MEPPLAFPFLELLLDLPFTDSGSIKKKVRHFMFRPFASTMSVFNCRAVGAEKRRHPPGAGRCDGEMRTAVSGLGSPFFFFFGNYQGISLPCFVSALKRTVQTVEPKAEFM